MGQAQINARTRACSRTSIARTKQAALTHNVRGKELTGSFAAFQKLNVTIWRMLKTMASIRQAMNGQAIRKLFSVLTTGSRTLN